MQLSLLQKSALFAIKLGIVFLTFIEHIELASIRIFQIGVLLISTLFVGLFVKFGNPILNGLMVEYGITPDSVTQSDTDNIDASSLNFGPVLANELPLPSISAKAALAVDRTTDRVLYEWNIDQQLAPASTTKLMTAVVALNIYGLDDVVTVPETCAGVSSQKAGLIASKSYTVKDLVFTLLVGSAGDSACTLARAKTPEPEFVNLMNAYAKKFEMTHTYFTNPIGLDGENRSHYSTASDLYKLAKAATANEVITEAVSTKQYIFPVPDSQVSASVYTTNELLWEIPESVGIKTGTTEEAGQVLIYEYKAESEDKDAPAKDIVIIVMGSSDRFADTKAILNWTLASYSWN